MGLGINLHRKSDSSLFEFDFKTAANCLYMLICLHTLICLSVLICRVC